MSRDDGRTRELLGGLRGARSGGRRMRNLGPARESGGEHLFSAGGRLLKQACRRAWWQCWLRRAFCFARSGWKKHQAARRIRSWTNSPSRRGCHIFSGRPCRMRNCYSSRKGALRKNLTAQVARLLKDERSPGVHPELRRAVVAGAGHREHSHRSAFCAGLEEKFDPVATQNRNRFNEAKKYRQSNAPGGAGEFDRVLATLALVPATPLRAELTPELRLAMRLETEKVFDYLLREDRSLLELLDADYVCERTVGRALRYPGGARE